MAEWGPLQYATSHFLTERDDISIRILLRTVDDIKKKFFSEVWLAQMTADVRIRSIFAVFKLNS